MNTTDTTAAAPFRVDAIYNPPIDGIYYEIEFSGENGVSFARIRDRSGFITSLLDIVEVHRNNDPGEWVNDSIIDPNGYAVPLSAVTYTKQQPPFVCSVCHQTKQVPKGSFTTGYGTDTDTGAITCFECIGVQDRERFANMKPGERSYLYLSGNTVSNWPGTFTVTVHGLRTSRHNFGCKRRDFWFWVNFKEFHGYQIGEFTQIANVRRTNRVWNPTKHKYVKET